MAKRLTAVTFLLVLATAAGARGDVLFGPRTFTIATGPSTAREEFAIETAAFCGGRAAFVLELTCSRCISSAVVSLNGQVLFRESDFDATPRSLSTPVDLAAQNELVVDLKGGPPGSSITIVIRRELGERIAADTHVLTEHTQSFQTSFSAAPSAQHVLTVRSGDPDGTLRPKRGSVRLNGVEIVTETELRSASLLRELIAVVSDNVLLAELHGDPGDRVQISVERVSSESACGAAVTITSPPAGATIAAREVLVQGLVAGQPGVGVTVQGVVAEIDLSAGAGPFPWFAVVPVAPGDLSIEAVARDAGGGTTRTSVEITVAAPGKWLALSPQPASGILPLDVTFGISHDIGTTVTLFEADLDGDGQYEYQSGEIPSTLEVRYETAGPRLVSARATDAEGVVTTTQTLALAQTVAAVDTVLRQTWGTFRAALAGGDVDAALALVAEGTPREKYGEIFLEIRDRLPQYAAGIETIHPVTIAGGVAHYLLTRMEDGRKKGYHIYFARDASGVWRIVQI